MNNTQLNEEHDRLTKLLKSQEDSHATKFSQIISEGAYRDSCERISNTYQQLSDIGGCLGIMYPVRMK